MPNYLAQERRNEAPVNWLASSTVTAPGAEMRAYDPSLADRARWVIDDMGRIIGYDDLGERTAETLNLLALPSLLSIPATPARAVAAGAGPAWDAAMARVLERRYPQELSGGYMPLDKPYAVGRAIARSRGEIATGGSKYMPPEAFPVAAEAGRRSAEYVAAPAQWRNPFYRTNDAGPAVGRETQRYLNELMKQIARRDLRSVE